jgi:enterochelin esterase family protein
MKLARQQPARRSGIAEASYDFQLVLADGGHSPNHAGVLLPDALRRLFAAPER